MAKVGKAALTKIKEWRSFGGTIQYYTHASASTGTEMTFSVLCVVIAGRVGAARVLRSRDFVWLCADLLHMCSLSSRHPQRATAS